MRSFEEVKPEFMKFPNVKTRLPERCKVGGLRFL